MIRDQTFEGVLITSDDHYRNCDLKNCAILIPMGGMLETCNLEHCLIYCGKYSKILNNGFQHCVVKYEQVLLPFTWWSALKMVFGGPKPIVDGGHTIINNRFINTIGAKP